MSVLGDGRRKTARLDGLARVLLAVAPATVHDVPGHHDVCETPRESNDLVDELLREDLRVMPAIGQRRSACAEKIDDVPNTLRDGILRFTVKSINWMDGRCKFCDKRLNV
jgi:hypothetical protein